MIDILYGLTGGLSLAISMFGMVLMIYFCIKNGFKVPMLLGFFILIALLSYLMKNPAKMYDIGELIFIFIFSLVKGG